MNQRLLVKLGGAKDQKSMIIKMADNARRTAFKN